MSRENNAMKTFEIQVPISDGEWVTWDTCESKTTNGPKGLAGRFCLKKFRIIDVETGESEEYEMKTLPW